MDIIDIKGRGVTDYSNNFYHETDNKYENLNLPVFNSLNNL
jgi:hypothetical protein